MSLVGHSHFALTAAMGAWIAIVFVGVARLTHASRRAIIGALAGGLVAGAVNAATDSAASAAGFWHYTEVTTPFGPLVYYVEAGIGCGALALIVNVLLRKAGVRGAFAFVVALGVYAPIRDWATARLTHVIAFRYEPLALVLVADALSTLVVPVLVAFAGVRVAERGIGTRT